MPGTTEQPRDRRRQARTPVNINALLIGEKTVPKGCRVINVSQYGMLLYCDADGRLSTFNDGDNVDIHLTVQHAGKQKKLTIPSCVRHVADNSVDVEFQHPDPILMDLIESYRVSGEHRLEASLGHNHSNPEKITRIGVPDIQPDKPSVDSQAVTPGRRRSLYPGLLLILFTLCVAGGGYVYTASVDNRINSLEALTGKLRAQIEDLQNRVFSTSLQEGRYASLNARITALGDAFGHLEDKITLLLRSPAPENTHTEVPATPIAPIRRGQVAAVPTMETAQPEATRTATEAPVRMTPSTAAPTNPEQVIHTEETDTTAAASSVPATKTVSPAPPASKNEVDTSAPAGQPDVAPPTQGVADQPTGNHSPGIVSPTKDKLAVSTGLIAGAEKKGSGETVAASATTSAGGPWIINLISSPKKGDILRMARLAQKAGISTNMEQAEVNGKQYWRLQTGGYPTLADAKQEAAPIKAALKLDNVWFIKKKQ